MGGKMNWGRGLRAVGPYPLPQPSSPNPLSFRAGEGGAAGPAIPGQNLRGLGGGLGGRAGTSGPWPSPQSTNPPRILLSGLPQCGKTTVVRRVVAAFPGKVAGFYTQEVRDSGKRVGFEIVTLEGKKAWLSHVDFPGPHRVGKYGVSLKNLEEVALPALEAAPGVELIVVDEIGKMECLSPRFVAAVESLWAGTVPLLITVGEKGGGYIRRIKEKPDKILITVTPGNRDRLPQEILIAVSG